MRWTGEIVGHRGAAGVAPENTLESFEAAIEAGADRIELDVRLTRDGHAVVFHDLNVDRFVAGAKDAAVAAHSLAEMKAIDVGAALGRPGCMVPSLEEALERLGRRARLNVEVKGSGADSLAVVGLAAAALRRHGHAADAVLSTFHLVVLRRMAEEAPEIARAYIVDRRNAGDVVTEALAAGCEGVHPHLALADAAFVERCHAAGLRIRCWTANEPGEIVRLAELGVDGIVSDHPGRVRELTR